MNLTEIRKRLRELADKRRAKVLRGYFKTGPGEYAEGDRFLGIRVGDIRKVAGECVDLGQRPICSLLASPVHEERLTALLILVRQFEQGGKQRRGDIYRLYLANTRHINNWDLVDLSAAKIVGPYLEDRSREPLDRLATSRSLWERRIAVATYHYIRTGQFRDTLRITQLLLDDEEDLIHKAVGWMLREVGKRNFQAEDRFLRKHYRRMPRTMLRYAIERHPEALRKRYLDGRV